jgi:hypothetical protein
MSEMWSRLKPRKLWRVVWRDLRQGSRERIECGSCDSRHPRRVWWPIGGRLHGVRLRGLWYCKPECLQGALAEVLGREQAGVRRETTVSHRVPLGLLLLSRQQLTAEQLRSALERQHAAGEGRIGDWLLHLGFVSEAQITAAAARQWACPVLRHETASLGAGRFLPIPWSLLECFQMIPVEFAESTRTLLMAFSEGVDHTVLYALEQMLGYRTQACFVCPSILQKGLQGLAGRDGTKDVVFDRLEDAGECARVIASYAAKTGAEEVRLAQLGNQIWIRLEGEGRAGLNLVLRSPGTVGGKAAGMQPFRLARGRAG